MAMHGMGYIPDAVHITYDVSHIWPATSDNQTHIVQCTTNSAYHVCNALCYNTHFVLYRMGIQYNILRTGASGYTVV